MKICAVGTELFHADRWTEGRDVARGLFFAVLRKHPEIAVV
jgi:hypothetical protein